MPAPAPVAPQAKKSRLPIIIGAVAAVIVVAAVCIFALGGKASPAAPAAAQEAIKDASALATELADRYEAYQNTDSSSGQQETRTYDMAHDEIQTALDRVKADRDSLKSTAENWQGYAQADAAMQNLEGVLTYEMDLLEVQHNSVLAGPNNGGSSLDFIKALMEGYESLEAPDCLTEYVKCTREKLPAMYAALVYNADSVTSTLSTHTANELYAWWLTKQSGYDTEGNKAMVTQCRESHEMLDSLASGTALPAKTKVEVDAIEKIAPNLYPSLDSAVIIGATAYDGEHSVTVSAEVVGFTQKFEQKYDLNQGYNYLPVKPSLLPSKDMTNLSANSTTQLDVKVTDDATGEVLAQQSQQVDLLSMYDFTWEDDEFGATAAFDILAWLRPQADEVNAINRSAADFLSKWTNGKMNSLAGYQYGNDAIPTLQQTAAIQAAVSQAGVKYIMDNYSFTSDQHVLTPDQVVKKQQGLCIETSLLMASCLMSAGMHPLIIITPGHAQVAVESYRGSGNFFLIETTKLPYSGVDTSYESGQVAYYNGLLASAKTSDGSTYTWTTTGSSDEWQFYFENKKKDGYDEYGGIFVIDCQLQSLMDIQGLENM